MSPNYFLMRPTINIIPQHDCAQKILLVTVVGDWILVVCAPNQNPKLWIKLTFRFICFHSSLVLCLLCKQFSHTWNLNIMAWNLTMYYLHIFPFCGFMGLQHSVCYPYKSTYMSACIFTKYFIKPLSPSLPPILHHSRLFL
jgi:hypothetical protein